jgi:hypothetical protein
VAAAAIGDTITIVATERQALPPAMLLISASLYPQALLSSRKNPLLLPLLATKERQPGAWINMESQFLSHLNPVSLSLSSVVLMSLRINLHPLQEDTNLDLHNKNSYRIMI